MNSRKRQAAPLLPMRDPKHPRLSPNGYVGSSPSPSETAGIGTRWVGFGKEFKNEFVNLAGDTVRTLRNTVRNALPSISWVNSDDSDSSASQLPSEPVDLASTTSTTPRQLSPTRPPQLASTPITRPISPPISAMDPPPRASGSALRPEDIPLPPSPTKFSTHSRTPSRPSAIPIPFHTDPRRRSTPGTTQVSLATPRTTPASTATPTPARTPAQLLTPPSTDTELQHDVVPRMRELQLGQHPPLQASQPPSVFSDSRMDLGSQPSRASSQSSKRETLRRNPRKREHIFAKVHKANVKRQRLEQREQITLEIYETKRKIGFKSGFDDFKEYLEYQHTLENINLEKAPHPMRLSALGGKVRGGRQILDLESQFSKDAFLQRALHNAKATLNSPKPAKPFFPNLEQLGVSRRAKDDAIEHFLRPPVLPLPTSLPPEDEKNVNEIMRKRGVIAKFAKEQVSHTDLSRLLPGQWLNDEIINFYGAMLLARSEGAKENPTPAKGKRAARAPLNVHCFSSFFWAKLVSEGYEKGRLPKWTKRVDIFSKDVVFMPVNHGNAHWTCGAINFRQKRFESYDSMGMAKGHVFQRLRGYVKMEHLNKKKKEFDFTGWEDWAPDSTPQQENGYDCGVFTCQFMEAISRGEDNFNFSQQDMPYLRRRMIWEIGNAKLRDDR